MEISPQFFYFFAALSIVCSLAVILNKSAISSAFSLIFVFFSFASIYAILGAHFIAAIQILVYAGAVMVLFVFVIMLLNAEGPSLDLARTSPLVKGVAFCLAAVMIGVFAYAFKNMQISPKGEFSPEAIEEAGGNTTVLSEVLFSDFILPFELTSVLLLSAIVGAVAIAMRKKKDSGETPHAG